jgi:succinate-semialdehyde dehydrogenase/glutarate-semialdehyde dehydrogenase
LDAIQSLVDDAVQRGARLRVGGKRIGNRGYYYEPTVIADCPIDARLMNEEPFGPLAIINSYDEPEQMISEANRLPYGLAAYAYTGSDDVAAEIGDRLQTGMLAINHQRIGFAELPFGGIKDSGYGTEGGTEVLSAYLVQKLVSTKWTRTGKTAF